MKRSRLLEERIFENFIRQLKNKKRFFCQHDFFRLLDESFKQYVGNISAGKNLYRARRMSKDEYEDRKKILTNNDPFKGFDKKGSFVLPAKRCRANRANTIGIPCLYVSSSENTAIAEVRPFKETYVSLATIKLKKSLRLYKFYFSANESEIYGESIIDILPFWYIMLNRMFSTPYEYTDNDEYLVTQCIAEYIRLSGKFDGILYNSSLDDDGENIALFNCRNNNYNLCEPVESVVYSINSIKVIHKLLCK